MVDLASDKEYADALANAVGAPLPRDRPVVSENFSPLYYVKPRCCVTDHKQGGNFGGLLCRAGTESCGGLHCKVVWAMCAPSFNFRWTLQRQCHTLAL